MRYLRSSLTLPVFLSPLLAALPLRADDLPVITIRTPAAQMKYDKAVITATPGTQVKLVFENLDEMPHNWVLCRPLPDKNDKGMEVAQLAWQLGAAGMEKAWVPDSPRVIAHTGLVQAHQKEELVIKVPDEPGIYPYVCTFPGHAMAMNGELRVLKEGPILTDLKYRLFLGEWSQLPDFPSLKAHREGVIPENKITVELEGYTQNFAVLFDGLLDVPADGEYEFSLASDDGSELIVDGRSAIKNDGIHPYSTIKTRKVRLTKGQKKLRLKYFEATGQEGIYLAWSGPSFTETPLSKWVHPSRRDGAGVEAETDEFTGIPLAPAKGEALIYRNFITGVSPRGIAVGYPNGVNLCFDADQMAPAMFWQGAFMDAKRHWTGRGNGPQPPLGYNIFSPAPTSPALAQLPQADAPWPSLKKRAEMLRFRGYRLDEKRFPTFKYEMGPVTVSESYQPAGSVETNDLRVTRTLHFSAPEPTSGLYLRAAAGGVKAEGGGWSGSGFTLTVDQGAPVLRGEELLIPVIFTGDTATVSVTYHWKS